MLWKGPPALERSWQGVDGLWMTIPGGWAVVGQSMGK